MTKYIEDLNLSYILKELLNYFTNEIKTTYYFDSIWPSTYLIKLANKILSGNFVKIDFQMMDIKDENGELVRVRIPRKDLFVIKNKIINHAAYISIKHKGKSVNNMNRFIQKGLIDGGIMEKDSISRALYIINVVHWHNKKIHDAEVEFIINHRPWFDIYFNYAKNFRIKLVPGKRYRKNFLSIIKNHVLKIIKRNFL